jgi:hypothetical protein
MEPGIHYAQIADGVSTASGNVSPFRRNGGD